MKTPQEWIDHLAGKPGFRMARVLPRDVAAIQRDACADRDGERERLLAIVTAAKALVHAIVTPPEDDPEFVGSYWWSRETEKLAEELVRVVDCPP